MVSGEEPMLLEHRFAVQRHLDVPTRNRRALGQQRLDKLGSTTAQRIKLQAA